MLVVFCQAGFDETKIIITDRVENPRAGKHLERPTDGDESEEPPLDGGKRGRCSWRNKTSKSVRYED